MFVEEQMFSRLSSAKHINDLFITEKVQTNHNHDKI